VDCRVLDSADRSIAAAGCAQATSGALAHVYDGPAEEGERRGRPLAQFRHALVDFSGCMPYRTIQTLYDAIFPKGRDRCYWEVHLSEVSLTTAPLATSLRTWRSGPPK